MTTEVIDKRTSIITKFADRFGVDPDKMLVTLKATAFRVKEGEVTHEQMMALLVVAQQYNLNPWTRELYAFPDKGGIVPVVSVDGWSRIMNDHAQFDGMEFEYGPDVDGKPEWIECTIYRKDRSHPIKVRERMKETTRDSIPWKTHPSRMLRHKAMIQCARLAFGFAGIYDDDEARRIIEVTGEEIPAGATTVERIKATVKKKEPATIEGEKLPAEPAPPKTEPNLPPKAPLKAPGVVAPSDKVKTGGPPAEDVIKQLKGSKTPEDFNAALDLIRSIDDINDRSAAADVAREEFKRFS